MKSIILAGVLGMMANMGEAAHIRNYDHQTLNMDSINPLQWQQIQSGDWTAILPDSIRQATKDLSNTDSTTTTTTAPSLEQLLAQSQSQSGSSTISPLDNDLNTGFNFWGHK